MASGNNESRSAGSAVLSQIRGENRKPALAVRRFTHHLGCRFRLHRRDLPGSPDPIFPSRRKVVFVHGCFWHRHPGCRKTTTPKTRVEFWLTKFARNVERDAEMERRLKAGGWNVLIIWECETRQVDQLIARLNDFLRP
ncbi:very short patch repair endonuclease [Methylobacterium sp. CM6244]